MPSNEDPLFKPSASMSFLAAITWLIGSSAAAGRPGGENLRLRRCGDRSAEGLD